MTRVFSGLGLLVLLGLSGCGGGAAAEGKATELPAAERSGFKTSGGIAVHKEAAKGFGDGLKAFVEHDKAFLHVLAAAERSARASAHAARVATGAIPVQAKLAYQLASVERDGDLGDELDALAEFWASSAFSQTAVMLARN